MSYSSRIGPTISSMRSSKVDDAGGATVLLDDHGDVDLALLHLSEQLTDLFRLGCVVRLARDRLERALIVTDDAVAQQILRVHDADDVVDVVLVDGDSRVARTR